MDNLNYSFSDNNSLSMYNQQNNERASVIIHTQATEFETFKTQLKNKH